ncbi:thiamine diphosphokinase [Clostridium thermarum]|uniref:thiamine diphosphokinase n=1 Tax=Clostridium thermarum TaxID=1716543 RepID=UPI0013CF6F74|nr:thiamine diphosphokinase [Clostridium thermarum]
MKALLISGGSPPSKELVEKEVQMSDYIIGIDKGLECLNKYNIEPDILVGDFDSVDRTIFERMAELKKEMIRFPAEKDYTDTQLAVSKVLELKADEVTILGATGSRLDHTLANVGLLYKCLKSDIKATIKDDNNLLFMADRDLELVDEGYRFFSLIAYGGTVKGLNIRGAKYELCNHNLMPEDNIAISNEFIGLNVQLSFKEGTLLIIFSRD